MWFFGFCSGIMIGIIGVFVLAYVSAVKDKKNDDEDVSK
jgi:hypothetical protein